MRAEVVAVDHRRRRPGPARSRSRHAGVLLVVGRAEGDVVHAARADLALRGQVGPRYHAHLGARAARADLEDGGAGARPSAYSPAWRKPSTSVSTRAVGSRSRTARVTRVQAADALLGRDAALGPGTRAARPPGLAVSSTNSSRWPSGSVKESIAAARRSARSRRGRTPSSSKRCAHQSSAARRRHAEGGGRDHGAGAGRLRADARPVEEGHLGAGVADRVAVEEVIGRDVVLVDRLLDQPQAETSV